VILTWNVLFLLYFFFLKCSNVWICMWHGVWDKRTQMIMVELLALLGSEDFSRRPRPTKLSYVCRLGGNAQGSQTS
jgi:hypothetical protein